MKITICGSLNFTEEMLKIKNQLIERGHVVLMPASIKDFSLKNAKDACNLKGDKEKYIKEIKPIYTKKHFDKIKESDAVLVVNLQKNGVDNYIGGATFAEIILAFHYNKKIFLWNPIPKNEKTDIISDEIESTKPIILNGDLNKIPKGIS